MRNYRNVDAGLYFAVGFDMVLARRHGCHGT